MALRHHSLSGLYIGPAFNLLIPPRQIWWIWLSLLLDSGWPILQSGDGDALYSSSGSVFTNISFNQVSGPDQLGINSPAIPGSLCNFNSYYVWSDPLHSGEWCLQIAELIDSVSQCTVRLRYAKQGYANGTATVAPAPNVAGDDELLIGGGTNSTPLNSYGYSILSGLSNMGIDGDATNPRAWLETHTPGPGNFGGQFLFFIDPVAALVQQDSDRIVTGVASSSGGPTPASLADASENRDPSLNGTGTTTVVTTFGGLTTRVIASHQATVGGSVVRDNASPTLCLGDNTISLTEDPFPLEWDKPSIMSQSDNAGQKGQSGMFQWITSGGVRAQMGTSLQGGVDSYIVMGSVYVPYNNGASPGVAGASFTL